MQVDDFTAAGTNSVEDADASSVARDGTAPAEAEAGSASPAAPQAQVEQAAEAEQAARNDAKPIHLAFIVVDSITAIIRPILTAKSPEGGAAARSLFKRLLTRSSQDTLAWSHSCGY